MIRIFVSTYRHWFGSCLTSLMLFCTSVTAAEYRIAVVQDGTSWFFEELASQVENEIGNLETDDLSFRWIRKPSFNAGWREDRVVDAFEAAFADPEVDAVLSLGIISLSYISRPDVDIPKPVVGGLLQEPRLLGDGILKEGFTQKPNLSLVISTNTIQADLEAFRRITPVNHVGVVIDGETFNAIEPDARAMAAEIASLSGSRISFIRVGSDPAGAIRQLEESGVDSLYLFPPFRINSRADRETLLEKSIELSLPTFAYYGERAVREGVVGGLLPDISRQLSRRIAGNLRYIADGMSPNELPAILQSDHTQLYLNLDTARAIGLSIPLNVKMNAITFGMDEKAPVGETISLRAAIENALDANFNYQIVESGTEASRAQRFRARSSLLPQVRANGLYSRIDETRAESSAGLFPEKRMTAGFVAEQVIYSAEAWGNFSASDLLYVAAQSDLERERLDIISNVSQAYIDLLKARALLRIAEENLVLTRRNLELARLGERIGANETSDVLRLEAAEAGDRIAVFNAIESVDLARLNLNREMNAPLETVREPVNLGLDSPEFSTAVDDIRPLIEDLGRLDKARGFFTFYAVENSPEVVAAEARLESARQLKTMSQRRGWAPTVAAQLAWDHILEESRIGPAPMDAEGNNEWTLGISVSIPVFEGGNRYYEVRERSAVLRQAELAFEQTQQLAEARARAALFEAARTSPNLDLSRTAAERARQNLEIVTDRYESGAANLVTLLDAQNAAFVQNQNEVLAVYEFLEDIVLLGRSLSFYEFMASGAERASFLNAFKTAIR